MESEAATIQAIYRYPVKGLSPQTLRRARLMVGQTIPADRLYAIENGPTGFDPGALVAQLRPEPSRNGDLFPHLYAALDPGLALEVTPLIWRDGSPVLP